MTFYTSLSGLQASQTDMSTISNNIANSATSGFKRSTTEFADVIASSLSVAPNQMVGSGTVVKATTQQFGEGSLIQSDSSLDLAISGDGFFMVKPQGSGSAPTDFTRNGHFTPDQDGYVTDAEGSRVQVYPVDGSGAVVASGIDSLVDLQLPQTSGRPVATQNVALGVNLNSNSAVPSASSDFTASNPYAFNRFDPSTYNQSTQTTVYDSSGNAQTMTNYFVRNDTPDASGNTSWSVYSYVGDTQLTSGGSTDPVTLTFNSAGATTSPSTPTMFDSFTPTGTTTSQQITFDLSGSTELSSPFNVNSRSQDGKSVGQLSGVTVDSTGMVTASFSNGDSQALGKVAIANFNNPSGLRQMGNSYWTSTGLSGEPKLGQAGDNGFGSLMSGMIEGSNVDITQELVDLIAAQQNFQANAKALDTSKQIQQTIFQIQ